MPLPWGVHVVVECPKSRFLQRVARPRFQRARHYSHALASPRVLRFKTVPPPVFLKLRQPLLLVVPSPPHSCLVSDCLPHQYNFWVPRRVFFGSIRYVRFPSPRP